MAKLHVTDHPLIQHKMALLRDVNTGTKDFRQLVEEIAMLICYEATRDIPLKDATVETPICEANVKVMANDIALVPVLRAGIGMVDGLVNLIPTAKVGHIGLYRDPDTLQPVDYFCKLPKDISNREVFILDPMLATGGTANAAITFLKDQGAKNIKFLCIIACPEGFEAVSKAHPDVEIYAAVCDEKLNDHGYIVPGLGDAGDRLFGTK